jgi:hypothetical protein
MTGRFCYKVSNENWNTSRNFRSGPNLKFHDNQQTDRQTDRQTWQTQLARFFATLFANKRETPEKQKTDSS